MRIPGSSVMRFSRLAGLTIVFVLGVASPAFGVVPLPTVNTEEASEVVFDAATLNGTVTPGGSEPSSDTKWCFEYGSIAGAGYNLGSVPIVAEYAGVGTSPVPVSVRLTGLAAGSTYRYRLVAVNALGEGPGSTACGIQNGQETVGGEGLFTTPIYIPPPVATTGSASEVGQNTATITGTVNPQGSTTTYEFQVGADTSYGVEVFGAAGKGTSPEPLSLTLDYLQPATTYHYRLLANNHGGTSYGADQTFTTGTYPTSTLTAPATTPLLAIPQIVFPTETQAVTTTGKAKKTSKTFKRKTARKASEKTSKKHQNAARKSKRKHRGASKNEGSKR